MERKLSEPRAVAVRYEDVEEGKRDGEQNFEGKNKLTKETQVNFSSIFYIFITPRVYNDKMFLQYLFCK